MTSFAAELVGMSEADMRGRIADWPPERIDDQQGGPIDIRDRAIAEFIESAQALQRCALDDDD